MHCKFITIIRCKVYVFSTLNISRLDVIHSTNFIYFTTIYFVMRAV